MSPQPSAVWLSGLLPDTQATLATCSMPALILALMLVAARTVRSFRIVRLQAAQRSERIGPPGLVVHCDFVLHCFAVFPAHARHETLVHLRTNVMLRYERQRKQQFIFDQIDE